MALALGTVPAWADGLIPAVNAYRPTPVFCFVFWVVILIESIWLRLWFRPLHYGSVLWRVLLLNAVSSLAGYGLMRSPFRPEFWTVWQQAIPFFFLTLAVEWPLVCLLFRRSFRLWKQSFLPIATANVLSYAFLIAAERPVEQVWLGYLWALDQQTLVSWTDFPMLAQATGRIYGTESTSGGPPHGLRFFSFSDKRWHSMTNCPAIDPLDWDVAGDLFAYQAYPHEAPCTVKLARLPAFAPVREIPIEVPAHGTRNAWAIRLSPDGKKLALLIWQHEIQERLSGSSYRVLATTSLLAVFDTSSGRRLGISPRKASSGLCWLPDSKTVLFHSLRNERLHELPITQEGWGAPHAVARSNPAFSDEPVYAFDVEAGTIRLFGEMAALHLAHEAKLLAWKSGEDTVSLRSLETGTTTTNQVGRIGGDIEISPDGRFLVASLRLSHPLGYMGNPTIVDLRDPSRKHYLGWDYRFVWTK